MVIFDEELLICHSFTNENKLIIYFRNISLDHYLIIENKEKKINKHNLMTTPF